MDFWHNLQFHKWASSGWILLFIISLLYIIYKRNNIGKKIDVAIVFLLLSIVLYFSPVFSKIMLQHFLPSYLEYERLSWLFFSREIIAFSGVLFIMNLEKKRRFSAIGIMLCFCLLISNVSFISRGFKLSENIYKVPDDVISISDAIISDTVDEKPQVLVQVENYDAAAGDEMYHGIRQYTSKPVLSMLNLNPETYNAEDFDLSDYSVMNYQYFVCHNENLLCTQAEDAGFDLLKKTDNYCLYKNTKEFALYFVRHGQTEANVEGIYAGSGTDAMLTIMGIQQAAETGEALSSVQFTNVFTSELTRTADTAKYIMNENDNTVPEFETISYLNDFYWGNLEGMTMDEVASAYPDFELDTYIGTADDTSFISPIGSWSKYGLIDRYKKALEQIAAKTQSGGTSLVVGHSAMIWYLQSVFPEEVSLDAGLDNAGITVLHYSRGTWSLEYLNLLADEYKELDL